MIPQVFQFDKKTLIRTVQVDGQVMFVGVDVCKALGYKNPADAMKRHCKGVAKHDTLATNGGTQEFRVLSEGDMVRLITNSQKPEAEQFERWVFDEVIPQVLKTGGLRPPAGATSRRPPGLG